MVVRGGGPTWDTVAGSAGWDRGHAAQPSSVCATRPPLSLLGHSREWLPCVYGRATTPDFITEVGEELKFMTVGFRYHQGASKVILASHLGSDLPWVGQGRQRAASSLGCACPAQDCSLWVNVPVIPL